MNEENTKITQENVETVQIVEETASSPKTIGELLKLKREEKNLTLKVISQQTKIHAGLLEYLENDLLDKLPSRTYVRGFVKSTSKILGINQAMALELLDDTYKLKMIVKEKKIYHAPAEANPLQDNFKHNSLFTIENLKSVFVSYFTTTLKFGSVLVLIVILAINLKNYVKNPNGDAQVKLPVVLTSVYQKAKPTPKLQTPKAELKVATPEVPITLNIIQDEKKDTIVRSEIVIKDLKLKPNPPHEPQFSANQPDIPKEKMDELLPARFKITPVKGVETVFLNATEGDSWITYKIDDREIKKYVLRQGRTVFMRGANIRLFIGNTKNLKVFYNNQLIELNAKGGMKNLVFPDSLKDKFLSPLFVFQKDGTVLTSDEFVKLNGTQAAQ